MCDALNAGWGKRGWKKVFILVIVSISDRWCIRPIAKPNSEAKIVQISHILFVKQDRGTDLPLKVWENMYPLSHISSFSNCDRWEVQF